LLGTMGKIAGRAISMAKNPYSYRTPPSETRETGKSGRSFGLLPSLRGGLAVGPLGRPPRRHEKSAFLLDSCLPIVQDGLNSSFFPHAASVRDEYVAFFRITSGGSRNVACPLALPETPWRRSSEERAQGLARAAAAAARSIRRPPAAGHHQRRGVWGSQR